VAPEKAPSKKGASQKKGAPKGKTGAKVANRAEPKGPKKAAGERPAAREGTAKAKVIGMLQTKGGATLQQIMKATGWQAHTIRGPDISIGVIRSSGLFRTCADGNPILGFPKRTTSRKAEFCVLTRPRSHFARPSGSGLGSRRFKSCRPDHHQTRLVALNSIGTISGWAVGWADAPAQADTAGKPR
jgi:hypothetical protein